MRSGRLIALLTIAIAAGMGHPRAEEPRAFDERKVFIFPVRGQIDGGMRRELTRAVEDYTERDKAIRWVIFEIDTPGGEYGDAHELANFIYSYDQKGIYTVAYIPSGRNAYSAGTILAFACRTIVMGDRSFMGAVAPVAVGPGIFEELPEKIQSPVRKDLEDLARRRGYPVALAQAMVSKDLEVLRVTFDRGGKRTTEYLTRAQFDNLAAGEKMLVVDSKIAVEKDRLLTLSTQDAKEFGFIDHVAIDRNDLFMKLDIPAGDQNVIEYGVGVVKTAGSSFWQFLRHPLVKFILILFGFIGIFIEIKMPGLGFPGLVGLACFVIFFGSGYVLQTVGWVEVGMFILGIALIATEIFAFPATFGALGVLGLAFLFASLVFSLQDFYAPAGPVSWGVFRANFLKVLFSLGAVGASIWVTLRFIPRSNLLQRAGVVHGRTLPVQAEEDLPALPDESWVGRQGTALTTLRPAGKADFDGVLADVVADGDFIGKGSRIVVIEKAGHRTVVRKV